MGTCSCETNFEKDYIMNSTKIKDPISNILRNQTITFCEEKFDINYEKECQIGEGHF